MYPQVNPLYHTISRQARKCFKLTHRRRQNSGAYIFFEEAAYDKNFRVTAYSHIFRCFAGYSARHLRMRKRESLFQRNILFRERDEVQTFYFLSKGIASLYKMNQANDCKVITVPKAQFRQLLAGDAGFSEAVMCPMAMKIRKLYRQMKIRRTHLPWKSRLRQNCGSFPGITGLCGMGGVEIDFDLSISFLAEMVAPSGKRFPDR